MANFIEPILAHLSGNTQLSLHAYSNNVLEDAVTQRLRGYFSYWHQIANLSDHELAQKVMADGIDILIDLSGHTGKHRLLSFARKPAPVQASWMGYPGTTGLRAMDYYLTDRYFLPQETFARQFTEKFAYLPASAAFRPNPAAPPVNVLPALANGYLTTNPDGPFRLDPQGWATVSDLARAAGGGLEVLGRGDSAVTIGGHTVVVEEVERLLRSLPGVDEIAVFGAPHPRLGQVLTAVVVGSVVDATLRAAVAQMPAPSRPRRWLHADALPRTSGGKVRRDALPDLIVRMNGR